MRNAADTPADPATIGYVWAIENADGRIAADSICCPTTPHESPFQMAHCYRSAVRGRHGRRGIHIDGHQYLAVDLTGERPLRLLDITELLQMVWMSNRDLCWIADQQRKRPRARRPRT